MQQWPQTVFVTGIGTGVGKTVSAAVLTEALQADYWKPVQCGNLDSSDSITVQLLVSNRHTIIHPESYRLKTASSPHYAARAEGVQIEAKNFVKPVTTNRLIVEGAGGLMVPLNEKECVTDVIQQLGSAVVLVCRNYLGSINHTLLSIEYLKQRNIPILGIIFSGDNFLDNEEIIHQFSQTHVLGRIDEAQNVDKAFIQIQAKKLRKSIENSFLI